MSFKRGEHVCALYSTTDELTREVASFLAEGLRRHERSWYVGTGDEIASLSEALRTLGIDVAAATQNKALQLFSGDAAYIVHGTFDPEATVQTFNDAIEQSYNDGFTGFRAAAEMSWALDCADGSHQVIVYEAMLRSLFASCRAIGLCLYHRQRMPLEVLNGALLTHPVAGSNGRYSPNRFYDPKVTAPIGVEPTEVLAKLAQCESSAGDRSTLS